MDIKILTGAIEICFMLCISVLCNRMLFREFQKASGGKIENDTRKERRFITVSALLDVTFLVMLVHFKAV